MSRLHEITTGVWEAVTHVRLGLGAALPLRMTALADHDGLTLVSPIRLDDELVSNIDQLGRVHTLIAPNLLHHRYLRGAIERYPAARLLGAPGLATKRSDLTFHGELATGRVSESLGVQLVEGAPKLNEAVLLHEPSSTLVVTDLVFNISRATGMSWVVLAGISRALGRVEQSRLVRTVTQDRDAAGRSMERILAQSFDRVVPAHGDVIDRDAAAELAAGVWWMRGMPQRPVAA